MSEQAATRKTFHGSTPIIDGAMRLHCAEVQAAA